MSALSHVFPRVHFRYERDPNADALEEFAAWLCGTGFPNKSSRRHLFNLQQALRAAEKPPVFPIAEGELAMVFNAAEDRNPRQMQHTLATYSRFLAGRRMLLAEPEAPDPLAEIRREFCRQLERRRGLRPSTISGYDYWIADFLRRVLDPGQSLTCLSNSDFQTYVIGRVKELAPSTLRNAIGYVRAFLRYCYQHKLVTEQIDLLDRPADLREIRPPRALPWPLVLRFLRTIDRSSCIGRRDYLILHLMAHYGLRCGEVGFLTLDSFNWRAHTMTVTQSKTSSILVLPLHDKTMRLLRSYLEQDRPATRLRYVFLTVHAPIRPMTKFALSQLFKIRARRSGLPIAHASSYSLRHSFAMRLFGRGVGIKAIGDLMGHRSPVSTGVYLRLQTDVLRSVALPVPRAPRRTGGAA